jgi:branched-chain amino acid transport system substrate-binding protein
MDVRKTALLGVATVLAMSGVAATDALAQNEQFIPLLVYRTGPFAPNGIPLANGFSDYFTLINERDGGVGGVKLTWEECETQYNNDRGVECYERLKNRGPTGATVFNPYSTGITYALIERATADEIPILSMGYGRTDASDGTVFPYVFTVPMTYWSQASALVKYVGEQEGGLENLQGKKIGLIYLDSAYGKEPIPTLEVLAEEYGYEFHEFPVASPGIEQRATWLQIARQVRPDWMFMWGWGVMNSAAIKEAAAVGYPMDHFIGVWWSGAEPDVEPAGAAAAGYMSGAFHAPGTDFPVFDDIFEHVYEKGLGAGAREDVGEVLYNRGIINAAIVVEAIRTAQEEFGQRPITGEEMRWGLENLDITEERLAEMGMEGFTPPIKVTCADHEGDHAVRIQQWDGENWSFISDWITPMQDVVRPLIEKSAAKYAAEKGITPRSCES